MTDPDPGSTETRRYVSVRMTEQAWELLRGTLEADSRSAAFDPALRRDIRGALDSMYTDGPCPVAEAARDVLRWAEHMGGWEAPCWSRLREAAVGAASCAAPPARAESALRRVYDVLYLDDDGKGGFYNPGKSWDADTLDGVAQAVCAYFGPPTARREP